MDKLKSLIEAEKKALKLFELIDSLQLIKIGKKESELNREVFELAKIHFGIRKFWHKRLVRSGKNTLLPYEDNPPDLTLQENDILYFDFGPVFEEWEADIGRTFVIGNDVDMLKLATDVEQIWYEVNNYYQQNKEEITASQLYHHTCQVSELHGWKYGSEHAGHLIGKFPHERILGDEQINYIHPENNVKMSDPDNFGEKRNWILEIHLVHPKREIGAFFEQLMIPYPD